MKRERRILAVTGDREIVVSVLYRGRFWFEGVDVKVLDHDISIEEVLRSKYLEQARVIIIDEEVLKREADDVKSALAKLRSMDMKVDVVVVKREEGTPQELKKGCRNDSSKSDVPEALKIARKIFYEVRGVIQKSKLR